MLREWVVRGGGLDEYFGEQGQPVGIQECLENVGKFTSGFMSEYGKCFHKCAFCCVRRQVAGTLFLDLA